MINKTTNLVDMSKNLTHDLIKGDHFIYINNSIYTRAFKKESGTNKPQAFN